MVFVVVVGRKKGEMSNLTKKKIFIYVLDE